MRFLASLFLLGHCHALWAYSLNTSAKTATTDGSYSDTSACLSEIYTRNEDDWVVVVGTSGGSSTWTSKLDIAGSRSITVQGAGTGANRFTVTVNKTGTQLEIFPTDGKKKRLTNFIFQNTDSDEFLSIWGWSNNVSWEVDNCDFIDCGNVALRVLNFNNSTFTGPGPFGLCWSNKFLNTTALNGVYVNCGLKGNGWTNGVMRFGTTNAVVVEGCVFYNSGTLDEGRPAIDASDYGPVVIFRNNMITNNSMVVHSDDTGTYGTLMIECHTNIVHVVNDQAAFGGYWRGGVQLCSGNTFTGSGTWGFNACWQLGNDGTATHTVGRGAGPEGTLYGSYFWGNTYNGQQEFSAAAGLTLNTDYFAEAPGPGLPLTSYTQLVYPHPHRSGLVDGGGGGSSATFTNTVFIGPIKATGPVVVR